MIYNEDGSVTYTKEEHESALEDSMWITALENAGVDNWEGYEFAMDIYQEMKEEE